MNEEKFLNLNLKNNNEINYDLIDIPAKVINDGGLILFPTETVYGIGADGLNSEAVKNIFIAKGRAQDNPLILHVDNFEMVDMIAKNISETERTLMEAFWPGPFTIVLDRKEIVPDVVTANLDTVGVRMPSNKIAHELIKRAKTPIAAPSANISGKPSGTNVEDIFNELNNKVDYIIDGGNCDVGLESTVVRVIDDVPTILRPGKITKEDILNLVGRVRVDDHVMNKVTSNEKVMSPGMKYRHYAPKSECILFYNDDNDILVNLINKKIEEENNSSNILILCSEENKNEFDHNNKNIKVITYGHKNDLDEIAKNVFNSLRKVDEINPNVCFIEGVKLDGLGLAIMNRLIRACSYNLIKE